VHQPKRRAGDDPLLALVVDVRQDAPEVARRLEQLADLLALFLVPVAVRASPSTPIVSACRVQSSGVVIEMYWWIRANDIGCWNVLLPIGGVGSSGGSPAAMRFAVPLSMARSRSSSKPATCAVRRAIRSELGCCP
jgi:hypothetical protein